MRSQVPKSPSFPYEPEQWNKFFNQLEKASNSENKSSDDDAIGAIAFRHKEFKYYNRNARTLQYSTEDVLHYTYQLLPAKSVTIKVSFPKHIVWLSYARHNARHNPEKVADDLMQFRLLNLFPWNSTPIRTLARRNFFDAINSVELQYHLGLLLFTFEHYLHLTPTSQQSKAVNDAVNSLCQSCVIL